MCTMKQIVAIVFLTIYLSQICTEAAAVGPWDDTSLCSPTDTFAECKARKVQCAPINKILGSGLFKSITKCSNSTGSAIADDFFFWLGMSFIRGNPESLMDNATTEVRECVLNSSGLIGSDKKLNRTVVMTVLASQPLGPAVILPVSSAVEYCPEPSDFKVGPFLTCLRKACMTNAPTVIPATPKPKKAKQPSLSSIPLALYSGFAVPRSIMAPQVKPQAGLTSDYAKYFGFY